MTTPKTRRPKPEQQIVAAVVSFRMVESVPGARRGDHVLKYQHEGIPRHRESSGGSRTICGIDTLDQLEQISLRDRAGSPGGSTNRRIGENVRHGVSAESAGKANPERVREQYRQPDAGILVELDGSFDYLRAPQGCVSMVNNISSTQPLASFAILPRRHSVTL